MGMREWLTIIAIVMGPIVALGLERLSERRRELRARRLQIFRDLMATRAAGVSARHVDALNAIDIEFFSKKPKDRAVVNAWKEYLDVLDSYPPGDDPGVLSAWTQTRATTWRN